MLITGAAQARATHWMTSRAARQASIATNHQQAHLTTYDKVPSITNTLNLSSLETMKYVLVLYVDCAVTGTVPYALTN
jgi:hypothetical protein